MTPNNPEAINPVDFGSEHQPLQESLAIETSTEVSKFNTDNFDIEMREFAESQTLQPVEECVKNKNYEQVEHVVGVVSNTPFKRNYDLTVDKLGLKSAELNTWIESAKFSPETTEWMKQVESVLMDINSGFSTEKLIKTHGEDKVIGSQGAFQFLLAFSRVYDVACNLEGENKVILGVSKSKNPASYVVLKKQEEVQREQTNSDIKLFEKATQLSEQAIEEVRQQLTENSTNLVPDKLNSAIYTLDQIKTPNSEVLNLKARCLLHLAKIYRYNKEDQMAKDALSQSDKVIASDPNLSSDKILQSRILDVKAYLKSPNQTLNF